MIEDYYGWNNKETWYVNLWLNAEPDLYQLLMATVRLRETSYVRGVDLRDEVLILARNELKHETGPMSDLLHHALNQVNWSQIILSSEEV